MSSATESSMSPPPVERAPAARGKGKATAKKPVVAKPKKTTTKKPAAKAAATKETSARPTWKQIITECIIANKEDSARQGVSRNTIKKFAEEMYHLESSGQNLFQLNRAITSGAEGGVFVLPKGPSGKVKLAPKSVKVGSSKENSKPLSKTAAKPAPTKKAVAKTAPTKPAPAKKATVEPKKVLAGKPKAGTTKKTTAPSKRGTAKKAVTGSTPAVKAKTAVTRKAPATKKATAKTTVTKPRSRTMTGRKVAA